MDELRALLGDAPGWSIVPLPEEAPEVEETGSTFAENARLKAGEEKYKRERQGNKERILELETQIKSVLFFFFIIFLFYYKSK